MDWLPENIEVLLTITGVVGGIYAYIRVIIVNSAKNWIAANYVPRKEVNELLEKMLQTVNIRFDDMSKDIATSAEAGLKLSEQINSQVQSLSTALLNQHRGGTDHE